MSKKSIEQSNFNRNSVKTLSVPAKHPWKTVESYEARAALKNALNDLLLHQIKGAFVNWLNLLCRKHLAGLNETAVEVVYCPWCVAFFV